MIICDPRIIDFHSCQFNPLPDDKIKTDQTFAARQDHKFNNTQVIQFIFKRLESIVGNRKSAALSAFSPFSHNRLFPRVVRNSNNCVVKSLENDVVNEQFILVAIASILGGFCFLSFICMVFNCCKHDHVSLGDHEVYSYLDVSGLMLQRVGSKYTYIFLPKYSTIF